MLTRPLIAGAVLLLAACGSTSSGGGSGPSAPPPRWLDDPYAHPACPRPLYLGGIGLAAGTGGEAREQARLAGMDRIIQEILVEVRSQVDDVSTTRRENGEFMWDESLTEKISLTSSGDLPGVRVLDRWQDPQSKESWALVAVAREDLIDQFLPGVEQANRAAGQFLSTAPDDSNASKTLVNAIQAFGLVSATFGDAAKAKVVGRGSVHARTTDAAHQTSADLLARASERLAALTGSVHVTKVAGDGQAGAVRGSLATPLTARFTIVGGAGDHKPIVGLPVRFRAANTPAPAISATSTSTNENGSIECLITDLAATGLPSNEVIVEVDLTRFGSSVPAARLPSETFVYWLPTPGQTSIAVDVRALYAGNALALDFVAGNIASHLSDYGFAAEVRSGLGSSSIAALAQALGPNIQYVVRGTAEAWHSSQIQSLHYYKAKATLEIINLKSGDVLSLTTDEAKAGLDREAEQGAVKVLRELDKQIRRKLDEEFVSLFLPPVS